MTAVESVDIENIKTTDSCIKKANTTDSGTQTEDKPKKVRQKKDRTEYQRKYYLEHGYQLVVCEYCKSKIKSKWLKSHYQTQKCLDAKEKLEKKESV